LPPLAKQLAQHERGRLRLVTVLQDRRAVPDDVREQRLKLGTA
jgi:hypothetical protein